jgi:hypothetical protein
MEYYTAFAQKAQDSLCVHWDIAIVGVTMMCDKKGK